MLTFFLRKHQEEIITTMIPKTNFKMLAALLVFTACFTTTNADAQFWKKLKKKAKEKLKKTEDKLVDKLDKKTDKVIDSTLDGKGKAKQKDAKNKKSNQTNKALIPKGNEQGDYGDASLNHSAKYGIVNIEELRKPRVQKEGDQFRITGYWITTGVDVFDGYHVELKSTSLDELKAGKSFNIPDDATIRLGYDPIKLGTYQGESSGEGQTYDVESGTISVTFVQDQKVVISFSGNATLTKAVPSTSNTSDEYTYIETPTTISGNINATSPQYSIIKTNNSKSNGSGGNNGIASVANSRSATTNIPGSFSFDKRLNVEVIDSRGDSYPMDILLGDYPDIYGMQIATKEMQGQGNVTIVNTPKSSTMFMDVAGMKMKKTTSLEELGSQYDASDKLPDGADFSYKKTGNTKTIAGYTCEEYKVDYSYVNENGSASLWISKDFPVQNMQLPMLGMTLNNPYYSGFVMEMNMTNNGKTNIIRVTGVSDTSLNIDASKFKKMGF